MSIELPPRHPRLLPVANWPEKLGYEAGDVIVNAVKGECRGRPALVAILGCKDNLNVKLNLSCHTETVMTSPQPAQATSAPAQRNQSRFWWRTAASAAASSAYARSSYRRCPTNTSRLTTLIRRRTTCRCSRRSCRTRNCNGK